MTFFYSPVKGKLSICFVLAFITFSLHAQNYCTADYANGTSLGDYISVVKIPGTNLNSTSAGAASPYYTLFPASGSTTASLTRGNTTAYTLQVAGGTTPTCYIAAWADWNHNEIFETSEYIGVSPDAGNQNLVTFTNGIYVPDSAVIGITRLRFRSSDVSPGPSDLEACNATNSSWGETEDYEITVECQFTNAPNVSFTYNDSIFTKSPVTLINGNSSYLVSNKWYINGVYVTNTINLSYTFQTAAIYSVCLKSMNCFGSDSVCFNVRAFNPTQKPIANFTTSTDTADVGQTVQLTDISAKGPSYWNWTFNPSAGVTFLNGTSSSSQNPAVSFSNAGVYQVCLWDSNAIGKSSTVCKNIFVYHKLCSYSSAGFTSSGTIVDDGGVGGDYSTGGTCSFLIDACASSVNLKFWQFDLSSSSYFKIYNGKNNSAPPLFPGAGFTGTILPGGAIGITANSGKMYIEFQKGFSAPGFLATWTTVASTEPPPSGMIIGPDSANDCGAISTFSYQSSLDSFLLSEAIFNWDMNYTVANPHINPVKGLSSVSTTYNTPGTYIVRLDVTSCGGTETKYDTVVVVHPTAAPFVNFKSEYLVATTVDTVTLTDLTSIDPVWRQWTVTGPGSVISAKGNSGSKNYGVRFTSPGVYSVQLKDSNCVASSTLVKNSYITVINYCAPVVSNLNPDFCIQRFEVIKIKRSNFDTIGLLNYTNTTPAAGTVTYRDNTNKYRNYSVKGSTLSAKVEAILNLGDSVNFKVHRFNNFNPANIKIWIDYDQDGTFQASELVASSSGITAITYNGNFSIPTTAKTGYTRLRIGTNLDGSSNNPCGVNSYGEFNDYHVKLLPGIVVPGDPDTIRVEIGRAFTDPGIIIGGSVNTVHTGLAFGTTITALPFNNFHKITATDIIGNTTTKTLYIKGTPDVTKPVITKIGADTIYVEVGNIYNDPGATANDFYFGSLTSSITTTHNVNINKVGIYNVVYKVKDAAGNSADSVIRKVIVRDTQAPTVSLIGKDTIIVNVKTLSVPPEPGFILTDNYYPIASLIKNINYASVKLDIIGFYPVRYYISDSSGNMDSSKVRVYHVVDTTAPVIILTGLANLPWKRWHPYVDPGNTVSDNYYTNLICTPDVSNVNINQPGTYQVKFNITDPSGNVAKEVIRTVVVDDGTGINASIKNDILNLYPNPNNGFFTVQLNQEVTNSFSLFIFDIDGKLIYSNENPEVTNNKLNLDLSKISKGVYSLKIVGDAFVANSTFVVD